MATALVLVPLALGIVWIGGPVFSAVIAFMLILLIFEWTRIVDGAEFSRGFYALSLAAIIAATLAARGHYIGAMGVGMGGGMVATALEWRRGARVPWALAGAAFLILPAIATLFVRRGPENGDVLTLILFTTVWATDSGAYLIGTLLGGPKLWPKLSPQKTWSGAVGGIGCGALCAAGVGGLVGLSTPTANLLSLGAVLGISAIAGDLIESALKRAFGVKDTGGAFPGHGGVLDRLDGFIVAASVLAILSITGLTGLS